MRNKKSSSKPSKASSTSTDVQSAGKKPTTPSKGKSKSRSSANRRPKEPGIPLSSQRVGDADFALGSAAGGKPTVLTARVTLNDYEEFNQNYPTSAEMFVQTFNIFPVGETGSKAREIFESATGFRLLTDLRSALSYGPASALTVAQVGDYINAVSKAYFVLLSTRNHMSACYAPGRRFNLRERLGLIYDEGIPNLHNRLAAALTSFYLPPAVVELIERIAMVHVTSPGAQTSFVQFCPWDGLYNTPASFDALYQSQLTALSGITNAVALSTAFSSQRYSGDSLRMVRLSPNFISPETYLDSSFKPLYNTDWLNIWSNTPYEGWNGVGRATNYDAASDSSTIYKVGVGDFGIVENVYSGRYQTADAMYQPGILQPTMTASATNTNNLLVVDGTGSVDRLAATTIQSASVGCLSGTFLATTNNTVGAIRPKDTYILRTTLVDMYEDVNAYMRLMLGQHYT